MHTYIQEGGSWLVKFVLDTHEVRLASLASERDAMALVNYLNGGPGVWPAEWDRETEPKQEYRR